MTELFCNVALAVPLRTTFTYAVPEQLRAAVQPGVRVLVPFRQKSLVGVVVDLPERAPEKTKIREISKVLDVIPALTPALIELGHWIAGYYLAPAGEVFRAMLPPATDLRAEHQIAITAAGRQLVDSTSSTLGKEFDAAEIALLSKLIAKNGILSASALDKSGLNSAVLQQLARRGLVEIRQSLLARKQKTQTILAWRTEDSETGEKSTDTPGENRVRPLHGKALEKFQEQTARVRELLEAERGPLPLPQVLRLAGLSRPAVERMLACGLLYSWEEPIDPAEDPFDVGYAPPAHELNPDQDVALKRIRTRFEGVAVLHSALTDVERAREWWRVRNGEARVVVGTRSAVFAPLERLGLIIVDEEQENSYKQEETPRYHGRDVAIVRAKMENAVALLGSATPSLESYHHATTGKYELLTLGSRVENRALAKVEVVDLREEFQQTHQASSISATLRAGIQECLANGTQALVLINRRGYSWSVLCRSCGASVQCANCSISMTYHKNRNRLECHYCGFVAQTPKNCPKCDSKYVYFFGEGSEHLEERLRKEFPSARIARLDRDTTRTKRQYQETLGAFAGGALDILVGTQMLAKGHDFQRVTLVGVISADGLLSMPDFRAAERTFQLLTQVAGRAGRGELHGRVLIQTYYPEHYAIQDAVKQDYLAFFERETNFRRTMGYPPFTSLANVIVRDTNLEKAISWSRQLSEYFSPHNGKGVRILGPATAPLARLKKEYRFQFLLKSPKRSVLTKLLAGALDHCEANEIPDTAVIVDMDPLSLM